MFLELTLLEDLLSPDGLDRYDPIKRLINWHTHRAKVVSNAPVMLLHIGVAESDKRRFMRYTTRGFIQPEWHAWSSNESKEVGDGNYLGPKSQVAPMRPVETTCRISHRPKLRVTSKTSLATVDNVILEALRCLGGHPTLRRRHRQCETQTDLTL